MLIEGLTETEQSIFEALATYRYLTAEQMMRLGVTSAKRHLYVVLRKLKLRQPHVIVELDFGTLVGHGRLPRLYALTPRGAEILSEALRYDEHIDAPKRVTKFKRDYFHRMNCVDFHITLRLWAKRHGAAIDFFETYYDHATEQSARGGFYPKTRIRISSGVLVPDAMFSFTTRDGKQRLCAFEMYNGTETGRVQKQLRRYVAAHNEEAIEDTYKYEAAARLICVFDTKRGQELVKSRMAGDRGFSAFAPFVFSKTIGEVGENFVSGWQQFHREEKVPLFSEGA